MAKSETTARRCAAAVQARPAPVDADRIRGAYEPVLEASAAAPAAPDRAAELVGCVLLLMEQLPVDRMSGEWRATAEHVLADARQLVDADPAAPHRLWDLATFTRALLTLYERGPLDDAAAARGQS